MQELFVHWGDGYGSFATNKVRGKKKKKVKPHDRSYSESLSGLHEQLLQRLHTKTGKQKVQRWLQTN